MNNELKVRLPEDNSTIEVKQLSQVLKDSSEHLQQIKRSTEQFREFNQRAKEFLEKLKNKP